jgi:hypothetical protein
MSGKNIVRKVLVAGSTGATGKHVVRMLLERGDTEVIAVARSKEKLSGLVNPGNEIDDKMKNLVVKEASIGSMAIDELKSLVEGCSAVVSCLGHNLTFKGIYKDGYFVSETAEKLTSVLPEKSCRLIHMGSDGVANPDGKSDPVRPRFELFILWMFRMMVPPLLDNEMSAMHLYQLSIENPSKQWTIVRPGDLIDKDEVDIYPVKDTKDYDIFDHPHGSLFGDNSVARSDVADFMVDLATMEEQAFQEAYNHKMPVIYQKKAESDGKEL